MQYSSTARSKLAVGWITLLATITAFALAVGCGTNTAASAGDGSMPDSTVSDSATTDTARSESSVEDVSPIDAARTDAVIDAGTRVDVGPADTGRDVAVTDSATRDSAGMADPDGYTWRRIETPGPSARSSTGAMVYDSTRQRVVLFGGRGQDTYDAETWEWDGSVWLRREPVVSPTSGARRMAFDRTRNVVVMFGGATHVNGQETLMNDTWEWDGNTWSARTPVTTPPARANHSLAYDSVRNRVVLFGGYAGTAYSSEREYLNDTWEWDGQNWTRITPANAPPARSGHSLFFDTVSQRTLLFGGDTSWQNAIMIAVHVRNDTWSWSGTTWTQPNDAGNAPVRRMASVAFDTTRNFAIMFGGEDIRGLDSIAPSHFLNDMWQYQNGRWTQIAIANGPSPRSRFALAYDEARRQLVLFGGMTSTLLSRNGETWVYGRN